MPITMGQKINEEDKLSFRAPPPDMEVQPQVDKFKPHMQGFLYLGNDYNRMLEAVRDNELKIQELKHELTFFEDKASSLILRICFIFLIFLVITAIWAFFLGR